MDNGIRIDDTCEHITGARDVSLHNLKALTYIFDESVRGIQLIKDANRSPVCEERAAEMAAHKAQAAEDDDAPGRKGCMCGVAHRNVSLKMSASLSKCQPHSQ
jgi:hypothetical protein